MIVNKERFGQFFGDARREVGMSQVQLSRKLGYHSPQFVSNWERGICTPPLERLHELVEILNLDREKVVQQILGDTEDRLKSIFGGKRAKLVKRRESSRRL